MLFIWWENTLTLVIHLYETGNTWLCSLRFDLATYVTMHIRQRKQIFYNFWSVHFRISKILWKCFLLENGQWVLTGFFIFRELTQNASHYMIIKRIVFTLPDWFEMLEGKVHHSSYKCTFEKRKPIFYLILETFFHQKKWIFDEKWTFWNENICVISWLVHLIL